MICIGSVHCFVPMCPREDDGDVVCWIVSSESISQVPSLLNQKQRLSVSKPCRQSIPPRSLLSPAKPRRIVNSPVISLPHYGAVSIPPDWSSIISIHFVESSLCRIRSTFWLYSFHYFIGQDTNACHAPSCFLRQDLFMFAHTRGATSVTVTSHWR